MIQQVAPEVNSRNNRFPPSDQVEEASPRERPKGMLFRIERQAYAALCREGEAMPQTSSIAALTLHNPS